MITDVIFGSPRVVASDAQLELAGIWRLVLPDESDDGTRSWTHVGITPCYLRPTGRVWIAALPRADVAVKDRLLIGERLFDVVGILGPGSRDLPRQLVCRELSLPEALQTESELALSA